MNSNWYNATMYVYMYVSLLHISKQFGEELLVHDGRACIVLVHGVSSALHGTAYYSCGK